MTQFSLIIPTLDRVEEVTRLLDSLTHQTCRDFEVILVDQNQDDRLLPLMSPYAPQLKLHHLRVQSKGAARARNAGLDLAEGDFVLWPDDDSWLPPALLEDLSNAIRQHPEASGLIGILVDESGKPHNRWVPRSSRQANPMDAFTRAAEPVLFFRRTVVSDLSGFDPLLGTGAQTPWGAGEGTDLCVRALKAGQKIILEPKLTIFHQRIIIHEPDNANLSKSNAYAQGMGAVLRKNQLGPLFAFQYLLIYLRALIWACMRADWKHVRYHWRRIKGLWEGYKRYP